MMQRRIALPVLSLALLVSSVQVYAASALKIAGAVGAGVVSHGVAFLAGRQWEAASHASKPLNQALAHANPQGQQLIYAAAACALQQQQQRVKHEHADAAALAANGVGGPRPSAAASAVSTSMHSSSSGHAHGGGKSQGHHKRSNSDNDVNAWIARNATLVTLRPLAGSTQVISVADMLANAKAAAAAHSSSGSLGESVTVPFTSLFPAPVVAASSSPSSNGAMSSSSGSTTDSRAQEVYVTFPQSILSGFSSGVVEALANDEVAKKLASLNSADIVELLMTSESAKRFDDARRSVTRQSSVSTSETR